MIIKTNTLTIPWKTFLIIAVLTLISTSFVNAEPQLNKQMRKDIQSKAHDLNTNNDTFTIAYKIHEYVYSVIQHKHYFYPRGFALAWYEKNGDCNEKALIISMMFDELNITHKIKIGYVKKRDGIWQNVAHMWIEFYYFDGYQYRWLAFEKQFFMRMFETGEVSLDKYK